MRRKAYIFPFQGILIGNELHLEGQILHVSNPNNIAKPGDSIWRNIKRTFHLYTPTKIKKDQGTLEIIIEEKKHLTPLDKYGYFYFNKVMEHNNIHSLDDIEFYISGNRVYINEGVNYNKYVVKDTNFDLGVISDIDDTILVSHSTNTIKRISRVGFKNAFGRKIVEETKRIYDLLNNKNTQFFYVSNSETNLYLLIKWMIKLHKLPQGPLFLKSIRNYRNLFKLKRKRDFIKKYQHKIGRIDYLLSSFKSHKFILIGDSSQADPEIYKLICEMHPGKVEAVFIRNLSKVNKQDLLAKRMEEIKNTGVDTVLYDENTDLSLKISKIIMS